MKEKLYVDMGNSSDVKLYREKDCWYLASPESGHRYDKLEEVQTELLRLKELGYMINSSTLAQVEEELAV